MKLTDANADKNYNEISRNFAFYFPPKNTPIAESKFLIVEPGLEKR